MALLALSTATLPPFAPTKSQLPDRLRTAGFATKFAEEEIGASKSHRLLVPLDYGDADGDKFLIRYFTDSSVFDPSNASAPIFVSMGGEGTAGGAHCSSLAKRHGALCVSVEHRFYGESIPMSGATTANYWAGLSVEANLADTAAVIDKVQAGAKRPVVAFGGSYSGATCAWMRQRWPGKVDGCVSSSGVVNAILDFPAFDTHVDHAVGDACSAALAAAYEAIDASFDAGDGDRVKALFNATNLRGTPQGDTDFFYAIADGPAMMDQYGGKKELCDGLAKLPAAPTAEQRIANLAAIVEGHYGAKFAQDCFYDSECVGNVSAPAGPSQLGGLNSRSWRFEKCSEVAYLQAAPTSGRRLRSRRLTLDALLGQCEYIFGAGTAARLRARNQKLNAAFGRAQPAAGTRGASKIFYLDFSDDPWAEASVKRATDASLPFCLTTCDGCGHCGAGVPAKKSACFDKSDAWVDELLLEARARAARGSGVVVEV